MLYYLVWNIILILIKIGAKEEAGWKETAKKTADDSWRRRDERGNWSSRGGWKGSYNNKIYNTI